MFVLPKFFLRFLHVSLVGDKDGGLSEGFLALVATTNLCGDWGGGVRGGTTYCQ